MYMIGTSCLPQILRAWLLERMLSLFVLLLQWGFTVLAPSAQRLRSDVLFLFVQKIRVLWAVQVASQRWFPLTFQRLRRIAI